MLDGFVGLLDGLMIFREISSDEWTEMVKIAFGVLLKNASLADTDMCAIAAAKLHTVIQTRKMSELSEGCYVLYLLNEIIASDLLGERLSNVILAEEIRILDLNCWFWS